MRSLSLCLILLIFGVGIVGPQALHSRENGFRNSLGMEFVIIPAGVYDMGSPLREPFRDPTEDLHRVTLTRPFYMQSSEVTVGQWSALMGRRLLAQPSEPDLPITRVSWFDCVEFIKRLNERGEGIYRLPTEAEWEYACRAGSQSAFQWGADIDCEKAMFGNSGKKAGECVEPFKAKGMQVDGPARVRSFSPNPYGLFDMHGNVWEWCRDWYGDYQRTDVADPVGPVSGNLKVRRGGSWLSQGFQLRCANRAYAHPGSRFRNTGLRLVMEAP